MNMIAATMRSRLRSSGENDCHFWVMLIRLIR
jgi:hypothetical protein